MNEKITHNSNAFTRLIEQLNALPGIGEKSANRLARYILRSPGNYAALLADAIKEAKSKIGFCQYCQDLTEKVICQICSDEQRDKALLCVVEEPASMRALEQTGKYRGYYHILHGRLSPLQSIGPETLRLDRLKERIHTNPIHELILALDSDPEGEATAQYIKEYLQETAVHITRIASGVPVGAHLQYVDPMTLSRALASRHAWEGE